MVILGGMVFAAAFAAAFLVARALAQPDPDFQPRIKIAAAVKSATTLPINAAKREPSVAALHLKPEPVSPGSVKTTAVEVASLLRGLASGPEKWLRDMAKAIPDKIDAPHAWNPRTGMHYIFDVPDDAEVWIARHLRFCPPGASQQGLPANYRDYGWVSLGKAREWWTDKPVTAPTELWFAASLPDGRWEMYLARVLPGKSGVVKMLGGK